MLSAAILFYLFLRLQSCLALYIDPPRPLRALKKEAKGGIETSPISVRRHLDLPILTVAGHCGTPLGYPQALPLVHTTAGYIRHFLLPILTAAQPPRIPYLSAILFFLFLQQPCLALWNSVSLFSGTPTCTKSYDGSIPSPFLYLSLRRHSRHGSSAPSCFARSTT